MNLANQETFNIANSNYSFSAEKLDSLEEMEYTLVTIALDLSGSMGGYENDMKSSLTTIIESCKKAPKADNILIRVISFNSHLKEEIGYVPIVAVDPDEISFSTTGMTDLYGAAYSAVGATVQYAEDLLSRDILCNGILFVITDGYDTCHAMSPDRVRSVLMESAKEEKLESIISVVIGLGYNQDSVQTETIREVLGFSHGKYFGEITSQNLAKLSGFVSKSVSSQSQSLGTGTSAQLTF